MFKFKITLDRHNARQKLTYCLLPDPQPFSLPSTFNGDADLIRSINYETVLNSWIFFLGLTLSPIHASMIRCSNIRTRYKLKGSLYIAYCQSNSLLILLLQVKKVIYVSMADSMFKRKIKIDCHSPSLLILLFQVEKVICVSMADSMFKRKIKIDCHSPRLICQHLDQPYFSLLQLPYL